MIYAVSRATPVRYAEMISTISSLSAGPGTRQNIDEFTAAQLHAKVSYERDCTTPF